MMYSRNPPLRPELEEVHPYLRDISNNINKVCGSETVTVVYFVNEWISRRTRNEILHTRHCSLSVA